MIFSEKAIDRNSPRVYCPSHSKIKARDKRHEPRQNKDGVSGVLSSGEYGLLSLVENDLAHVAQLVEHILGKDEVTGSSPVMGSIYLN